MKITEISESTRVNAGNFTAEERSALKAVLNGGAGGQFGLQPGSYSLEIVKVTVRRKGEQVSCFAHAADGRYIYLPRELGEVALDNVEHIPFTASVTVGVGTPRIGKDQNGLPAISLLHPVTGFEVVTIEATPDAKPDVKTAKAKVTFK